MDPVETVVTGSLLLALPVAFAAGVVSFVSPCVLPLVPGYLSYVTGLTGAELAAASPPPPATVGRDTQPRGTETAIAVADAPPTVVPRDRSRVLAGSVLFVLGFSLVFVSLGTVVGWLGTFFLEYSQVLTRITGAFVIVLGLAYLGAIPALSREWRVHHRPAVGMWSAPLLGIVFGLGWSPCLGPTIGAVQTLALTEASAARGALLSLAYSFGLGLPFVLFGLAFQRGLGASAWIRRHGGVVMRVGGVFLVVVGLLLVTGVWTNVTSSLTTWAANVTTAL